MTGWCRLWIHDYGIVIIQLYKLLKGNLSGINWTDQTKEAFNSYERQQVALGVLAQRLGPYKRAVAYFSKWLEEVSRRMTKLLMTQSSSDYCQCSGYVLLCSRCLGEFQALGKAARCC